MPGIGLKIDPVGEDAGNVSMDLNDGSKFRAMEFNAPSPDRDVNWASSADTEGALPANLRYQNRQLTITCRVVGSSASDLQTQLGFLEQKIGRVNDEGATLEYVSPSGAVCVFDLLEGAADYAIDNTALANRYTTVTITFTAKPFWRGGLAREIAGEDHKETAKPCVIGVDLAPAGDVPALGRLVVDDDQGQDQWTLLWGVQSRYLDTTSEGALFYEAESRTPQGGAFLTPTAGASGPLGENNSVQQPILTPNYQSMLSTQAAGGGKHLSHIGSFRIFARLLRPITNTGQVSVCLEWGEGDFRRRTRNEEKTWAADELEGEWTIVDLGLVHLSKVVAGAQRWEGRLLAKSTVAGDDLVCDALFLFPVDEGYGVLKIEPQAETPTVFSIRDEFDQSSGVATGKTPPVGGAYIGALDADDFAINTADHTVRRTAVSDVDTYTGRILVAGTPVLSDVVAQVDLEAIGGASGFIEQGVTLRYVDANNWVKAVLGFGGLGVASYLLLAGRLAGAPFQIAQVVDLPLGIGARYTLRAMVLATGRAFLWFGPVGTPFSRPAIAVRSSLLAAGTLLSGKTGLYDTATGPTAVTRIYDNFEAFVPTLDAAVFASQSAEIRSDRMLREDAAGTLLAARRDYKGAYFRPPPARREGRSVRTIVKLSRGNVDSMDDPAIDDASFRIFWQPRGLVLPES